MSLRSLQPQEPDREVEAGKVEVEMEMVGATVEVVAPVMEAWED